MNIFKDQIETQFLNLVRKPSRYIGSEVNSINKPRAGAKLSFALCFPDIYEIGMSHTGLAILYDVLNSMEAVAAHRCFTPWIDAAELLRKNKIPLFALESKEPIRDYDVIGFSLTTELCYTNMLLMLDLAGLELRSKNRKESDPLVIAGGQMANCCEPVANFVDIFILGEAEETIVEFAKFLMDARQAGKSKSQILLDAGAKFDWAYVPSLYEFEYDGEKIASFKSAHAGLRDHFHSAVVSDFDNAHVPQKPIVPYLQPVHERVSIEIMRGCPGRCRFCQASFCRRPIRYRSIERIVDIAKKQYHATGFDTISLLSLSTADYPDLEGLVVKLNEYFTPLRVGLSLPSLRVDQQLSLMPKLGSSVRKSGLTIAVEAASQNLRLMINKPLTDENLFAGIEAAYRSGYRAVKLYFMVGFPGETQADILAIVDLCVAIARLRKNVDGKTGEVTAAVSWLVPKTHTPFQYLSQQSGEYFENARRLLLARKKELGIKYVSFKFHNFNQSILESAIGRGDRKLCNVIEAAYRAGAKFDLWDEAFDMEIWRNAFKDNGSDVNTLAQRQYSTDEILPWQHLGGPSVQGLLDHYLAAQQLTELTK